MVRKSAQSADAQSVIPQTPAPVPAAMPLNHFSTKTTVPKANYCKTAAICIKPFVDQYPYEKNEVFTADESYIKIRGLKTYVWLIMNAATRSILGND